MEYKKRPQYKVVFRVRTMRVKPLIVIVANGCILIMIIAYFKGF